MGGSTKKVDTTPALTQAVRSPVVQYLNGTGPQAIQSTFSGGPQAAGVQTAGPVGTTFNTGTPIDRSMVSNVNPNPAPALAPPPQVTTGVPNLAQAPDVHAQQAQSVDQLGGANSAFFQNMMAQLAPAFAQQRAATLAAAKEGAGNLTGSGLGNTIGNAMSQTLGQQQAQLAQYAAQGLGLEQANQAANANRALTADQSNQQAAMNFMQQLLQGAGLNLQGQGMNQQAGLQSNAQALQGAGLNLQAQQANQGADLSFLSQLLNQNAQGLQAQGLGLQAQTQNQNTQQSALNAAAANQQQANMLGYQTQANQAQQNAANFLQLLMGQSLAGVSPNTIQQSGGFGALLSPIATGIGTAMGGPIGGAIGSKITGLFGGGKP